MDFLWKAFEITITVFESFLITYFICSFMGHNFSTKKGIVIFLAGGIAETIIVLIMNHLTFYEGVLGAIYVAVHFIYALICLKGSVLKKLFISILTEVCLLCVNALVTGLLSMVFGDDLSVIYTQQTLSRFLAILIVQALLVYLFSVILKFTSRNSVALDFKEWLLILSVFGISFIAIALIHFTQQSSELSEQSIGILLISELGIIIINIVCFYMTLAMSKGKKAAEELMLAKQQEAYGKQYAEAVRHQYEETRRIRHDIKQSYTVIGSLIKDGKYEEAQEYILSDKQTIEATEVLVDVGNDFINAMLNAKLTAAKTAGAEVICGVVKDISGVKPTDLCNLLGNLLDNALEAVKKCESNDRLIEVNIHKSNNSLVVTVSNTISDAENSLNNISKGISSKADPSGHGFGAKSIKRIAEKYNGTANFFEDDGLLCCQVELVTNS